MEQTFTNQKTTHTLVDSVEIENRTYGIYELRYPENPDKIVGYNIMLSVDGIDRLVFFKSAYSLNWAYKLIDSEIEYRKK
jgi:hypothetical protein